MPTTVAYLIPLVSASVVETSWKVSKSQNFTVLKKEREIGCSLTNGKCHSVHYWVMDAHGRLLSTKEAQESHKAIAECDSCFLSA